MDNSLDIELFLMGWTNARDGVSLSLAWPAAMRDGWRLWNEEQKKVLNLAACRRRACDQQNLWGNEKSTAKIINFPVNKMLD